MTSRDEHVKRVKERAVAELDAGNGVAVAELDAGNGVAVALASIASDLGKHPETRGHTAIELGHLLANKPP